MSADSAPVTLDYRNVWHGILEWKAPENVSGSVIKRVQCFVSTKQEDNEFVKTGQWPRKLSMMLIPKQSIRMSWIGNDYLKNSVQVLFRTAESEISESLFGLMKNNFAGCVQFKSDSTQVCDLKVLILLFSRHLHDKEFIGFIPKNQDGYLNHLRSLIRARISISKQCDEVPNTHIWQGVLDWEDRSNVSKVCVKRELCFICVNNKDNALDLDSNHWPHNLIMHLFPKQLLVKTGNDFLTHSVTAFFKILPSNSSELLTAILSTDYAGCVYLNNYSSIRKCSIRILILLYSPDTKVFVAFIPKDQSGYVDRLINRIRRHRKGQSESTSKTEISNDSHETHQRRAVDDEKTQSKIMTNQSNLQLSDAGSHTGVHVTPNPVQMQPSLSQSTIVDVDLNDNILAVPENAAITDQLTREQNRIKMERLEKLMHEAKKQLKAAQQQEIEFQKQQEERKDRDTSTWEGILEWKYGDNVPSVSVSLRQCFVTVSYKNNETDLKSEHWPPKLNMELFPRQLFINTGRTTFKYLNSVSFEIPPCESSELLASIMSSEYVGFVKFDSTVSQGCDLKLLLLVYIPQLKQYQALIPIDQGDFVDSLLSHISVQYRGLQST